jgi:cobyrinic acid a,c-diamide synthase
MRTPRILIGGMTSGSGKTMITCGILKALQNRGICPVSFKCGPDYIDPLFHQKIIGIPARNIDTYFTEETLARYLLKKSCGEISIIEGVMGYYDGLGGVSTKASTYDVAKITETPAVLVVNCKGMSLSIVAHIKGFLEYREDNYIQGIILNQISEGLFPRIKQIIETELKIEVFGYVPSILEIAIESRYLGLVLPNEIEQLEEKIEKAAQIIERTVDLEKLLLLANRAKELMEEEDNIEDKESFLIVPKFKESIKIAVARDEAFCFLYEDNLDLLKEMGGELVYFSPIHDRELPLGIQGMILSGGYPELYAKELSQNKTMRKSIKEAILKGAFCMAECGGFMYLHTEMEDDKGLAHEMVGLIQGKAFKTKRLGRFGYIQITEPKTSYLLEEAKDFIRGHEFHYFDSTECGEDFLAVKPITLKSWSCMHGGKNILAGFPHLYYYSNINSIYRFISGCVEGKE